eukprot:TRINITY_DN3801_c0_g1_i1.p2 TRINITY_DN3801_c0_g1~~TRINITY_DN3801_c0_g1_i1.p2  ORF type:complete len:139 (+),score=35.25 TRINITY_DN3801_c0_g1_i1:110-526(+)
MFSVFFFFFKQKTAYEMLRSLVGSEMCIRDRYQRRVRELQREVAWRQNRHRVWFDGCVLSRISRTMASKWYNTIAQGSNQSLRVHCRCWLISACRRLSGISGRRDWCGRRRNPPSSTASCLQTTMGSDLTVDVLCGGC